MSGFLQVPIKRSIVSPSPGAGLDAFGRQRVSEPYTIFDSKQLSDKQPLIWDDQEISGGSTTSTYSADKASTTLGVGATTAGVRTRQTFQRFNYQPGKSQQIMMTGQLVDQSTLTGITAQIGFFDDDNGIFFSSEDGTIKVVTRSKVTGSVANTKVAQGNWNGDRMDGSGPSGVTLDFTKVQIFMIDYEWLGVGSVRMSFVVNGLICIAHTFLNANILSVVYMSTPNLPVRYSLQNDGTGAATNMQHICSSVASEGGREHNGIVREIDNGTTEITATTGGTTYALMGLRLKAAYLDTVIDIINVSVLMTSAGAFHWEVLFNPTVANTFTYGDLTNSALQFVAGTSANTVTGGTSVAGGYGASTGTGGSAAGVSGDNLESTLRLGSLIDGTPDEIVLVVTALANSETFLGSMTVRELS